MDVAEKLVGYRAGFNADVLLLDPLDEVWPQGEPKAMSDSLAAKKNGICKLGVLSRVRFTCVQIELVSVAMAHFESHNLVEEVVDG